MDDQQQSKFEGWAVVEMFGHLQEIGFVTTAYFGGPALFRIDQPEFPARVYELPRPQWIGETHCPAGTKVERSAHPGKTVFIGPSSIFRLTPCTEEAARQMIERNIPAPIKILSVPEGLKAIAAAEADREIDLDYDDEGQ